MAFTHHHSTQTYVNVNVKRKFIWLWLRIRRAVNIATWLCLRRYTSYLWCHLSNVI